jgi:hypothetical protein
LSVSWVVKHRPKHLREVAGNKKTLDEFTNWIKSWKISKPEKKSW